MTTREFAAFCARMGLDPMKQLGRVEGAEAPKRSKYGARKCIVGGLEFDSQAEAKAWLVLLDMNARGDISDLIRQPRYLLQEAFRDESGKKHRRIEYVADFQFHRRQPNTIAYQVAVDVKGFSTPVFLLKQKLFAVKYPHIRLEVWKTGRPV